MSDSWRPLSQRTGARKVGGGPFEGVPDWLRPSLVGWVKGRLWASRGRGLAPTFNLATVQEMERRLQDPRLNPTLPNTYGRDVEDRLLAILSSDDDLFLDALDFLVSRSPARGDTWPSEGVTLTRLLDEGGSAWTVAHAGQHLRLERRLDEGVRAGAELVMSDADNASEHLRHAWDALYGRTPSAGDGYWRSVRAVEAVAKPVVLPTDAKATLGKMIPAFRDGPTKWTVTLSEAGASTPHEVVLGMLTMLWTSQHDRHGTDDDSVPTSVSIEEARAALHLALTLVHWFRSGVIARAA